jgi:beta-galactosidase
VEAVDANGDRCPTFQHQVDLDIAGPGVWRGGYNSGRVHSTNNHFLDLECGINRVAVRATRVAGAITVTAHCSGLKSGSVTITSRAESISSGCSPDLPVLPAAPALVPLVADDQVRLPDIEAKPALGRYLKAFSYSGPAASVLVKQDAREGEKIYADRDFGFRDLPQALLGCDWVQTANADKLYNAVDLVDFSTAAESIIYVAHDERLPVPEWLRRQLQATDLRLSVNGQRMKVYERRVNAGESMTFGANTEDARLKSCNMYIVFVKAASGS